MQHYLLALIYTYKCTASCDICCFSCSPEREEKMSLSDAKRYVSEAKKCGVKMVGIAGGEPLIFFDEIIELAKYTKSLGMNITLTTNCFWAESYNISLEILETLRNAGINHIKISSDEFHGKYIPYENIKNVLNAAKNINLKVVVGCTVTKNSDRLRGLLSHIEDESTGTILLEQTCYPLGRAKEYFKEDQFIYKKNIDRFCKDGGMITITPDGSVYPCGSMFSIISNRLVGSMCEHSYELIAKKST
ncbi:radical SAM domain-containing protein [Gottschalkia acidurici 9a]|uniref:Radical SAM domain-containing protein n=1 Tax=Gottschalkia acidurici (strain ATCC 7906 / DSM 604 / BCRC 14475 / CIP 104303 / KCTC 5404 / NCIMB 10678 / 9a) TaxID=1128398 RepID=K0AYQ2_GOTA9|nr:radical SAM protein [Gottschalkia acidurici]AFS77855.1 radical SAM domain-containing protein [Gottschalkia acidurici 9a]